MPYDGSSPEARALLGLENPSLEALAFVLRDRRLWPVGFEYARWGWLLGFGAIS